MITFYEIIIKEMFSLNKTKILQYLIDFMVVSKNSSLDLLSYNFQVASSPSLDQCNSLSLTSEMPGSMQTPSERRPAKYDDTSYNFKVRSDPIYLQACSRIVTSHSDAITCRMSPRCQQQSFERRPFDNNVLKGRRIGRRLTRSTDSENVDIKMIRSH